MPGLDRQILDNLNPVRIIERVKIDLRSDFILAPHYNAIFVNAANEVWTKVQELLRSGNYHPDLPHTISVPKERGFTRPGSILSPLDRFVYQALIDHVLPVLEEQLDRQRTFSHVLARDDRTMFVAAHESWVRFQGKVAELCHQGGFIVKVDIANYFERIPHHNLINLMSAAGCVSAVVNLVEEMLLAFQERNSFGIVQGLFPSDVLGNYFLSDLDAYCELHDIPSARYVDDIFMHFSTEIEAQKGLIDLIGRLRKNGLHLNEYKSGIKTARDVRRDESVVDNLFDEAREEVREELTDFIPTGYGFSADWELEEPEEEEVKLAAVQRLYAAMEKYPDQADKIEKFCLPILRAAGSDTAVRYVVEKLVKKPYLTRIYHAYLSRFVGNDQNLVRTLESLAERPIFVMDYQKMYLLGSLFNASKINKDTVNLTIRWLEDAHIAKEVRALAAIFAAKHGNATQKRAVKVRYENEPAGYVREAILYTSRYFPPAEKRTCKKAWGGHSVVNSLIAQAM